MQAKERNERLISAWWWRAFSKVRDEQNFQTKARLGASESNDDDAHICLWQKLSPIDRLRERGGGGGSISEREAKRFSMKSSLSLLFRYIYTYTFVCTPAEREKESLGEAARGHIHFYRAFARTRGKLPGPHLPLAVLLLAGAIIIGGVSPLILRRPFYIDDPPQSNSRRPPLSCSSAAAAAAEFPGFLFLSFHCLSLSLSTP